MSNLRDYEQVRADPLAWRALKPGDRLTLRGRTLIVERVGEAELPVPCEMDGWAVDLRYEDA